MSESVDWKKCTVAELRDHCTKYGLVATGKKQELVDRLDEHKTNEVVDVNEEAMEEEVNGGDMPDEEAGQAEEEEKGEAVVKEEMDVKEDDVKQEKEEEKVEETKEEKKEEPIMVLRGKFHFYYNINHALKMVIIKPFTEDLLGKPELTKWCKQAKHFDIQKLEDGYSEAVLYFDTIAKGDGAFAEFKATIESEEVKVIHPAAAETGIAANSVSISAGQYWDKLADYSKIAKQPATMEESKSEALFSRHVVLENVPDDVTEEELVDKFPDAISIHVYPYSEACKGIRMLEFSSGDKASSFIRETKALTLQEQPVKVEKYSSRVQAWEKEKRKNEPYKPCTLTDEERIEKCKSLKALEEAKNAILNRDDLFGDEKILEHITVHEQIKPFTEQLKMDTNRRKEEKLSFPEPDELKNNYTKFAEAPDFGRRKKMSIFGKKKDAGGPGNKRQYDSGARGYDQPPHKRQMMGGGGGGGGGYGFSGGYGYNRGQGSYGGSGGGGGGHSGGGGGYGRGRGMSGANLMDAVKGLTSALSNMERNMGGSRYGGGGGGGGGGYRGMRRF